MPHRRTLPLLVIALVACSADPGVSVQRADDLVVTSTVEPTTTIDENTSTDTGDGIGDELFPDLGNPGIDVQHYTLDLAYDPDSGELTGSVTIDLTLTQDRDQITLDSIGPEVRTVMVDGAEVAFESDVPELRIDLPDGLAAGDTAEIVVDYTVNPKQIASETGVQDGWIVTDNGSFVLNEPEGARTWLPCNDHPSDKATWTFRIGVPDGMVAVANGALAHLDDTDTLDTYTWEESDPMATYLIQVLTGDYVLVNGEGPHRLPLVSVVLADDREAAQPALDLMDDQIAFFEEYFGPYPLDRYGIAITDSVPGLAMETQGRSYFSREDVLAYVPEDLFAHELAHMWFGDAVTPERWIDIWLNESFASYAAWMWIVGGTDVDSLAEAALANRFPGITGAPRVDEMFGYNSYDGGAVVLHALRRTIGDHTFFELLQRWVADNNGTSQGTDDFIALAEEVSGQDLDEFFDTWLFAAEVPDQLPEPSVTG